MNNNQYQSGHTSEQATPRHKMTPKRHPTTVVKKRNYPPQDTESEISEDNKPKLKKRKQTGC